jgi:UDP-N-acetylglucosamine--N-acetylmuramyl-(pentapeptide) pyrophosphoryl-undecaprenol N-acetylglucosamine transferase
VFIFGERMSKRKTFIFTGGGTGGHVAPALAIAEGIRVEHPNAFFLYVGLRGKAEDGMVQKAWKEEFETGLASIRFVRSLGFPGMNPRALRFAFELMIGIMQAVFILLVHRPQLIIATGGYVSAPIVFAAQFLRMTRLLQAKIFLHEQNAVLGRMNREGVRFADCVGTAFPGTKVPSKKKEFVGYPVRAAVVSKKDQDKELLRRTAREALKIPHNAKVIFAFGGSQGARTINRGLVYALPVLLSDPDVYVIHGTGRQLKGNAYNGMNDVQELLKTISSELPTDWKDRYRPTDFFYDMGAHYNATDLVVCRGGAGSLYEVCANGVAAISIPKANLPGDHQAANARSLERLNALRIIYERVDITQESMVESVDSIELSELILSMLNDSTLRSEIANNAHAQYAPDTTAHCASITNYLLGLSDKPVSKEEPTQDDEKVLGLRDTQLEELLRRVRAGRETLSSEERRIALYKIDSWAAQKNLVSPARASRMFGEGRFIERLGVLERFALDKRMSPFTRRDALKSIRRLEIPNLSIMKTLLKGLDDDYFESIVEALKSIHAQIHRFPEEHKSMVSDIEVQIQKHARSRTFDVRMNACLVLSEICSSFAQIESHLRDNYFHPNWKVRMNIVSCFDRLIERKVMTTEQVREELKDFLQTSNGFDMHFALKSEIRNTIQKNKKEQIVDDLQDLLNSTDSIKDARLQQMKEFSYKHNIAMNITEVLDKLTEKEPTS